MKRLFDVVVASIALMVALPLMGVIALLIYVSMGSPVLFWQTRAGLRGVPFCMVKFRTMRDAHDSEGNLLASAERVTKLGRMLRATSLDELPELWNVLKGDMSLVGPRPLLMDYLPLYTDEQALRHDLRPGLTGWAQINGRNALSWEDKFQLDVWYVKNRSIRLDLLILVKTLGVTLQRSGINASNGTIMGRFKGSSE